jgi:hypothetical protein
MQSLDPGIDLSLLETLSSDGSFADPLGIDLPNPADETLGEHDFFTKVNWAWQICDRFDLQTDIWRGRILRVVRDREKQGRGAGFLNWLKDHEISKTQAYSWIELANSADTLQENQALEPQTMQCFSKRAFLETAQAPAEVQQMVVESAQQGNRITRREVRELKNQWTAMTSDLVPESIRAKAANSDIPSRYMTPFVKEIQKLPESHQRALQAELQENPSVDALKQATADARYLARYLEAAHQVQTLDPVEVNLEAALEEALRLGILNLTADLMNQSAQLEQTLAKLYSTWKRLRDIHDKLYTNSGASTPHLRHLLDVLSPLTQEQVEIRLGADLNCRQIRIHIQEETP